MKRLRGHRLFIAIGGFLIAGCGSWHAQLLPSPTSAAPAATGWLRAGMHRVDITPPPGLGLGGSGPEGRRSTGYRTRLYIQALVLEDATGERIALVTTDLAHVSTNLHRLTAERLARSVGIGADRLIMSATHTHSGPAHFYAERQYNASVSRVGGYDPRIVDFLVERFTEAVEVAARDLQPATAATGTIPIIGETYNRSLQPFCQNPEHAGSSVCSNADRAKAVDSVFAMVRVDRLDTLTNMTRPLGSYSVFAIHGTGIPSLNTLYDGDIPFRVVRALTRKVDSATGYATIHALANGTEGDVAPAVEPRDPSCRPPRLGLRNTILTPKGQPGIVDFLEPPPADRRRCLDTALETIDLIAQHIADSAMQLYTRLGRRLTTRVPMRRVFRTAWLPGTGGLCNTPILGSGAAGGAEGAETRVRGWDWLFWPLLRGGIGEGGPAVDPQPGQCHSPKRGLVEPLQSKLVVGEHGFPEIAQFTLVRVGDVLFAATPGEITTTAGDRVRAAMRAALRLHSTWNPQVIAVISLANGFIQYVPTREEYGLQHYEGGSALYGPGTAQFFSDRLSEMVLELPTGGAPSPAGLVAPITAYPGPPTSLLPTPPIRVPAIGALAITLLCRDGRLTAEWTDLAPTTLFPRAGPLGRFVETTATGSLTAATDGDGSVEVEAKSGSTTAAWTASWRLPASGLSGEYRFERLDQGGTAIAVSTTRLCTRR